MGAVPVIKAMIRIGASQRGQKGGQTGILGAPAGPSLGLASIEAREQHREPARGRGRRALPTLARAAKPGVPAAEYLGFAGEAKSLAREVPNTTPLCWRSRKRSGSGVRASPTLLRVDVLSFQPHDRKRK